MHRASFSFQRVEIVRDSVNKETCPYSFSRNRVPFYVEGSSARAIGMRRNTPLIKKAPHEAIRQHDRAAYEGLCRYNSIPRLKISETPTTPCASAINQTVTAQAPM